ncbi:3-phosphoshikimate 1-carboxyvinyltransferase [bacterium]|nr:3-phosphoshikimate 1-carboxyvinyltransferase [bacterium]
MRPSDIHCSSAIHIDRELPGDKSISHRAAIIAAIGDGESVIQNRATGADVVSTLQCLSQLGVEIETSATEIRVKGKGLNGLQKADRHLDCGNSGTTARLLAGVLAGQPFESVLAGDESLSRRPMRRIAHPLRRMGAGIQISEDGTLPMTISGSVLKGLSHTLEAASAQVKSCLLLAGMYAQGETTIFETIPTRDHTERLLPFIRKEFLPDGHKLTVQGGCSILPFNITVPGDFSSAAFLIAAGILIPDSHIRLRRVGLNPTRTGLLDVLEKMGAQVTIENHVVDAIEPFGDIVVSYNGETLHGCFLDEKIIAGIIDEIPILAVLGTQTDSGLEIRNASELRNKECDRIRAIVYNLRQMGAEVDEFEDGLFVHPSNLRPAAIKTFGDHRIAMAFTIAAMAAGGVSTLDDSECVAISFPGFMKYLGIEPTDRHRELLSC